MQLRIPLHTHTNLHSAEKGAVAGQLGHARELAAQVRLRLRAAAARRVQQRLVSHRTRLLLRRSFSSKEVLWRKAKCMQITEVSLFPSCYLPRLVTWCIPPRAWRITCCLRCVCAAARSHKSHSKVMSALPPTLASLGLCLMTKRPHTARS